MVKLLRNKKAMVLILVALVIASGTVGWVNKNKLTNIPVMGNPVNSGQNSEIDYSENASAKSEEYIANARMERDRARSKAISELRETMSNKSFSDKERESASSKINEITTRIEMEPIVENLLKAKGFEQTVLFLGDDYANLVVKSEQLSKTQIAQIKNIIIENTKIKSSNIRIVPVS